MKNKPEFPFPHDNTVKISTTRKYLDQIVDGILDMDGEQNVARRPPRAHHRIAIAGRSTARSRITPRCRSRAIIWRSATRRSWIFSRKKSVRRACARLRRTEVDAYHRRIDIAKKNFHPRVLQHGRNKPLVFVQYGTGCPMMDGMHIKVSESWGADGVLHFDPAWGARTEGLMDGFLTNAEDGTPVTYANLSLIKRSLDKATLWTVRAHRGLNTPEIAVLSGFLGADLTKINIGYGSICGGTDPARLTVDGVEAVRIGRALQNAVRHSDQRGTRRRAAAQGVCRECWSWRNLAGGSARKPILKPLLCHGPYIMVQRIDGAELRGLQLRENPRAANHRRFSDLAGRTHRFHDARPRKK